MEWKNSPQPLNKLQRLTEDAARWAATEYNVPYVEIQQAVDFWETAVQWERDREKWIKFSDEEPPRCAPIIIGILADNGDFVQFMGIVLLDQTVLVDGVHKILPFSEFTHWQLQAIAPKMEDQCSTPEIE